MKLLKNKKINFKKIAIYFFIFIILMVNFSCIYGATTPTLVNKLNTALKKIQEYLVKLATPAAGVAIAVGVLMR